MGRIIPIFKVILQDGAKFSQLRNIPEVKRIVIEEVIYAIKDGLKRKKNAISLFEIADSKYYVNLDKSQWKIFLHNAINYFSGLEAYEKCVECQKLIEKLV